MHRSKVIHSNNNLNLSISERRFILSVCQYCIVQENAAEFKPKVVFHLYYEQLIKIMSAGSQLTILSSTDKQFKIMRSKSDLNKEFQRNRKYVTVI